MTLNQLNYFVATCNNGQNMTNAARSLFVTQSAISCAIKDLEEEFQIELFVRGKKNLYLTEAGKRFYQMASQVLEDAERLTETFHPANRERTAIRVGMTSLTANLLGAGLEKFRAERPDRPVRLTVFQAPRLRDLLRQGILDMAVMGGVDGNVSGEQTQVLGMDRCALYVRKDHPLAQETEVRADQLTDLPLCYFFDSEDLIPTPGAPLAAEQFIPGLKLKNVQMETTFLSAVNEFISEGGGGAIVAGGLRFGDDDVRQIAIQGACPFRIVAVWRKGWTLPPDEEALLREFQEVLTDLT